MVQFTKLRIQGFKSFVDRTELEIASGLNGVVGPNGCGKSNLVEALRWVMGENSAKRMRGGGMEDVIFNGTTKRSQRNIAEVSLLLDNSARTAPAAYNGSDEIEVTRRIERDRGSNYKINGKSVRMRDVQMLFADTVTGANSPALVSQGRITQIINAKPFNRRMILEESAGISGLYARRHEAELRLKAADGNLVRIEDILGSMEGRLGALKRQARQATRYRNVSTQIRQFEILIGYMEWQALNERMSATTKKFEGAESIVAHKLGVVTQLTKTHNAQAEELHPLRQAETAAAAALQTQNLALQRLEDETGRLEQLVQESEAQLAQTVTDEEHERHSLKESTEVLERIEGEQASIIDVQDGAEDELAEKDAIREELENKVIVLEERYTALMQGEAEAKARNSSLEQQIQTNSDRFEVIQKRKVSAQDELDALKGQNKDADRTMEFESAIKVLEEQFESLNLSIEKNEGDKQSAQDNTDEARDAVSAAESNQSRFEAEVAMLESFFEESDGGNYSPVLDSVAADSGFEKALSRALGDALLASLDDDAPSRWVARKALKDMPALPKGIEVLLPHVKAPKELHLALSQIGVVSGDAAGDAAVDELLPGQALVSSEGTYWRWDGFCVKAEASDRNALHLEQKNKLKDLEAKTSDIDKTVAQARKALDQAVSKQTDINAELKEQQEQRRELEQSLTTARGEFSTFRESRVRFDSELTRLQDMLRVAEEDIKTLEEVIQWDKDRLKAYEKETAEQTTEDTDQVRQNLQDTREAYQEAIRAFDMFQQQQNSRKARMHAIADERINIQNRAIRSRERLKQLEERKAALSEKLAELKKQPKDFEADKEKLLTKISEFESARDMAAEKLAATETGASETTRALKDAESVLGEAREERAAAQATLSALKEQHDAMKLHIYEQFEMEPAALPQHATIDMDKELGNLDGIKDKKEKMTRERDNIGPVNLRADEETQELEKEVTVLIHERNDLLQAIEELRKAINTINKEARERLVTAFEHVNAHFQDLFTRLFGGGKAHLELIDSGDPLGAGLEIFAQPPGKTLQSLSLLSGGEQTMASIALIFAMFLTNPSPICVLDEIDAPLDDANVDRVCDLLEEISERGETRFLVITHHRMTMARMDRLYGVTMSEKGVSQLVSVDLQQSFSFLEAA